jgi:hypothetical protein
MSDNPADEPANAPLETRIARHLARSVYMPHQCRRRACRRRNCCRGSVSETGEPCCVAALTEADRRLFSNLTQIARDYAEILRRGGDVSVEGCPFSRFILRLGLWAAIAAYADLPVYRQPLRHRLIKTPFPPLGMPPRQASSLRYRFGLREPDTRTREEQPSQEAAGR